MWNIGGRAGGRETAGRTRMSVGGWCWDGSQRHGLGWCGLDWYGSEWGPVGGSYEHGDGPSGSMECWEFLSGCTIDGFSGEAQLHEVSLNILPDMMILF
jgi:hypothetical protein